MNMIDYEIKELKAKLKHAKELDKAISFNMSKIIKNMELELNRAISIREKARDNYINGDI